MGDRHGTSYLDLHFGDLCGRRSKTLDEMEFGKPDAGKPPGWFDEGRENSRSLAQVSQSVGVLNKAFFKAVKC
jgi:hypothetical protein